MFGFFCNQNGKQLSDEVIKDTLKNIGVRGITERIRRKVAQQLAANFGEKSQISPKNAKLLIIASSKIRKNRLFFYNFFWKSKNLY